MSRPLAGLVDFAEAKARFDRMARSVPLDSPWSATQATRWDRRTFESWIRSNAWTPSGRELFRIFSRAVFAAEPSDFSLLHALFYTHSGGGMDSLTGVQGGAQQDRIVGGSQLIALRMAQELGRERVRLGTPVRQIIQDSTGVSVKADGGVTVRARRAVVAVPPALAGRIGYTPALPAYREQLTQRVPQGSVIQCCALYKEPFWREQGLTGQVVSDTGPVMFTYDISPPDGEPGVLVGYLEGQTARRFNQVGVQERRAAVLKCFGRYFGDKAAAPSEYLDLDWSAEEWTRGCYSGHFERVNDFV
jgi:monoamine oxidase